MSKDGNRKRAKEGSGTASSSDIEGIGSVYAAKLNEAGLQTTDDLLFAGGTPQCRASIAEKTGIGDGLILEWVNHADLYRIKGVGSEYADLLEEAGTEKASEETDHAQAAGSAAELN